MKRILLLGIVILSVLQTFSQYNPRPTRSRFFNNRMSTFNIYPGDTVVYTIEKDKERFDLALEIKEFGNSITFDYWQTDIFKTGNLTITAKAVSNAIRYDSILSGTKKILSDESIFWLSRRNFMDIAATGSTDMDLGNGSENFTRPGTGIMKINYKGKEKIITVYKVQNNTAKRKLLVLNDETNPMIVKMDIGWTITLKEVR